VGPDPDGCSPQTAISVGSVGEEYAWVARNLPGARLVHQALTFFEGKPLDVLTLSMELGDERQVFFDISSFYGRERGRRSSVAPCPYCGAALRTESAKQCFECGTDWRDPANVIRRGKASIPLN
jgi:hypothetical protein